MRHFKKKIDEGANVIFTQMFYDADGESYDLTEYRPSLSSTLVIPLSAPTRSILHLYQAAMR